MSDKVMLVVKQPATPHQRPEPKAICTGDERAMRDHERPDHPVIVPLPREIDIGNAECVGEQLRAAFAPGVAVVVADMGSTVFCDTSGARQLVLAHKNAVASNRELRVVVPSAQVLRVLAILGLDHVLKIYPRLAEALADQTGWHRWHTTDR